MHFESTACALACAPIHNTFLCIDFSSLKCQKVFTTAFCRLRNEGVRICAQDEESKKKTKLTHSSTDTILRILNVMNLSDMAFRTSNSIRLNIRIHFFFSVPNSSISMISCKQHCYLWTKQKSKIPILCKSLMKRLFFCSLSLFLFRFIENVISFLFVVVRPVNFNMQNMRLFRKVKKKKQF